MKLTVFLLIFLVIKYLEVYKIPYDYIWIKLKTVLLLYMLWGNINILFVISRSLYYIYFSYMIN